MKRTYTVYFEIGGHKMKTTIEAAHEIEAKDKVREKINFVKIKELSAADMAEKEVNDLLDKIFGK